MIRRGRVISATTQGTCYLLIYIYPLPQRGVVSDVGLAMAPDVPTDNSST